MAATLKLKLGTKIVVVIQKAVNLSTIPLCTEFRCESDRDAGISPNPSFRKVVFPQIVFDCRGSNGLGLTGVVEGTAVAGEFGGEHCS